MNLSRRNFIIKSAITCAGISSILVADKSFATDGYILVFGNGVVLVRNETMCSGCGKCLEMCPADAIYVDDVVHIDSALCYFDSCTACVDVCPSNGLEIKIRLVI